MWKNIRTSLILLVGFTMLTGIVYPLCVLIVAQVCFPKLASGSLIVVGGQVVGSELIGQEFSRPEYFWGRISATGPVPYNASASSGSNFGPMHDGLAKNAQARLEALRMHDAQIDAVPIDLVTSSASGLDPHISPEAAAIQIQRVAKARNLSVDEVRRLVKFHTQGRQFGILGEPRVNVLALNLALDALHADTLK